MMNAGSKFSHEELVMEEGNTLEGLQIFLRPEKSNLSPQVQFYDLPDVYSKNQWRKIAGKGNDYPLEIRSSTWLMDLRLEQGEEILLPEILSENAAFLFYVFDGEITVDDKMVLSPGESAIFENEYPIFFAERTSDIVLFITKPDAVYFDGGMYSGNLQ